MLKYIKREQVSKFFTKKTFFANIMATNNEVPTDTLWEEMKSFAVEQQQCFYELLPDCTEYKFDEENKIDEHKYLRQNIGFAIYGLPKSNEDTSTTESNSCYWKPEDSNDTDADIADTVNYDEKAERVIDIIYNKICECTIGTNKSQPIYFGIIYNVIFRPKMNVKENVKKEEKKETKTEVKEEEEKTESAVKESIKKEEEKTESEAKEKIESAVLAIPIFKIRRNIQKKSNIAKYAKQKESTSIEVETDYETWYIDVGGRVYKSWIDYIKNNNLPKCTMVLPKDGFYQADLSYPISEDYSTVWLEIVDSSACAWTATICDGIDVVSTVAGFGSAGLCIASLFTPIGPVTLAAGLVATGASSFWGIGRSSQQLADRINHEESINPLDKDAFPHWLNIASTTFGLGALGGSAALSKAVVNGKTIPIFAKVAFNTVQSGNLILNGAGIVYQSYHIIDKYRADKTVQRGDVLNLAMNIMFFAGSVVKIQFANDIIKNTQGKYISDYKDSLRKKTLRKKFNRVMRKAAENNTCKISENAEVIKYIKNREQLSANQPVNQSVARGQTLDKTSYNVVWSFEHGKLKVNGITLLDPIEYVARLMKSDIFNENNQNNFFGSQNYVDDSTADQLKKVFSDLLTKFYKNNYPMNTNLPLIPDFEPLLKDMSSMKIDQEYLKRLFKIVEKLMKRSKDKEDFLLMAFALVWQYCKANLKQWGIISSHRMQSNSGFNLQKIIIIAVSEAIDMILDNLYSAFVKYIEINLRR